MRQISRLFLALIVLCPFVVHAQWQRLTAPTGGTINEFLDAGDAIYAAEGDYGLGDLYKSTDIGLTWSSIGERIPGHPIVLHVQRENNILFAGTSQGLFESSNEGLSWKLTGDTMRYYRTVSLNNINGVIYFGAQGLGLFKRLPSGVITSANLPQGTPNVIHAVISLGSHLFVATNGDGIFRWDSGAASWSKKSEGLTSDDNYVSTLIAVDDTIYAGTLRSVYRSTDLGEHWVPLNSGIPASGSVQSFFVTNTDVYANTMTAGIYRLRRGDTAWKSIDANAPSTFYTYGLLIKDSTLLYGSQRLGVLQRRLSDQSASVSSIGITSLSIAGVRVAAAHDGSPELFAGSVDADFGLGWRSTDHGDTWSSLNTISDRGVHDFVQFDDTVLAGTDGEGIARSTDCGQNWTAATVPTSGLSYVTNFCKTPTTLLTIASGSAQPLSFSTNGGLSWQPCRGQVNASVSGLIYDSASKSCFATTAAGSLLSTDDGKNWNTIGELDGKNLQTIASAQGMLWAGGFSGLFNSSDGGKSWQSSSSPLLKGHISLMFGTQNLLAIATDSQFVVSTMLGSWRQLEGLPAGTKVISLDVDDRFMYAGLNGLGLWRTALPSIATVKRDDVLLLAEKDHDRLVFSNDITVLSITDIMGRDIRIDHSNAHVLNISDLSMLPFGEYFLSYEEGGRHTLRFLFTPNGILLNR
jgi:hypothetical protein